MEFFSIASRNNVFSGNHSAICASPFITCTRMTARVTDNVSVSNTVGYAVMYSASPSYPQECIRRRPRLGFLFNFANGSHRRQHGSGTAAARRPLAEIGHARWSARARAYCGARARSHGVAGARIAPEKCIFIYNTNQNRFHNNWFEGCEVGVHFTAGSEGNEIVGNAFIRNRNQVKYVGTRFLDWSKGAGAGTTGATIRPSTSTVMASATAPIAQTTLTRCLDSRWQLLVNSPAVQVIRWAQAQFLALLPGGVVDTHPLMTPPARKRGRKEPAMTRTVQH